MGLRLNNKNDANGTLPKQDVLSIFKEKSEKNLSIQQGLSVDEISDIVSERLINVVIQQFEETKARFINKVI